MTSGRNPNILICPLDWGLGHITRSEVIAKRLVKAGCSVIIAGTHDQLKACNPDSGIKKIHFGSYRARYSRFMPQQVAILLQFPMLAFQYLIDRIRIRKIIRDLNIDILISDNRFGSHSSGAYSVYITHQLSLKTGRVFSFGAPLATLLHRAIIKQYDECWVPDNEEKPWLAGELSHPDSVMGSTRYRYIGWLSRLDGIGAEQLDLPRKPFSLLLLSGPEPQRTMLGELVKKKFEGSGRHLVIVAGRPGDNTFFEEGNITRIGYLGPGQLVTIISEAENIICRSGYSSLMDLCLLNRPATLIPTPGQPEQEYLAEWLEDFPLFQTVKQTDLAGSTSCDDLIYQSAVSFQYARNDLLDRAIRDLLDSHHRKKNR